MRSSKTPKTFNWANVKKSRKNIKQIVISDKLIKLFLFWLCSIKVRVLFNPLFSNTLFTDNENSWRNGKLKKVGDGSTEIGCTFLAQSERFGEPSNEM